MNILIKKVFFVYRCDLGIQRASRYGFARDKLCGVHYPEIAYGKWVLHDQRIHFSRFDHTDRNGIGIKPYAAHLIGK